MISFVMLDAALVTRAGRTQRWCWLDSFGRSDGRVVLVVVMARRAQLL